MKVGGGGRMVGVVEGEFDRVLPEDMVYFRTSDIIEYECCIKPFAVYVRV